ncbi:hypothetical protein DES53_102787 [Roseimicrobium gellanilyticum]|uniref:Uncharacterized protein n=1 Tax=Roseimicrobium gellanilyticum TaxID=748857 RepID=A0A366HSC0_9BACT|nr:hypothetical protein [Roseimicrobium gellanilyticum]RBP46396.1 hypothetical protein DES53_102787 [Roseimicrobium gellanilyticum]
MVIPGEIQRVEISEFKDKQTQQPVRNYRILVGDKTKVFRCTTPFQFSMSEEKFRAKFGNKKLREYTDDPVTIAVVEMKAMNGFMSIRGEIVAGHHAANDFADLLEPEAAAPAPSPAPLGQPSKTAKAA